MIMLKFEGGIGAFAGNGNALYVNGPPEGFQNGGLLEIDSVPKILLFT